MTSIYWNIRCLSRCCLALLGTMLCIAVASAQQYNLFITTKAATPFPLYLNKFKGTQTITVDSILVSSAKDVNINLQKLDTGFYQLSSATGASKTLFIGRNENVIVEVLKLDEYIDYKVTSVETKLNDSLNIYFINAKGELDNFSNSIYQLKRTMANYHTVLDSLEKQYDEKVAAYNTMLQKFIARHSRSVSLNAYYNLFSLSTRADSKAYLSAYQTDEAFQKDHDLDKLRFANKYIINNPAYYARIDEFIGRYADKDKAGLFAAADIVLEGVSHNAEAKAMVVRHIMEVFQKNTPDDFYLAAADRYVNSCNDDADLSAEKLTIERIKALQIGNIAPEISVNRLGGDKVTLSSLKGTPIVVIFWASWCNHCQQEIPKLKTALDKVATQKDFKVLAISLDDDAAAWSKSINDLGIAEWINANEFKKWKSMAAQTYNVHQTPAMFIIDSNGIIKAKNVLPENIAGYL